jgi:predicted nucleic acid-binding protein
MTGLDTNVLARYYIGDTTDAEAELQRDAARRMGLTPTVIVPV